MDPVQKIYRLLIFIIVYCCWLSRGATKTGFAGKDLWGPARKYMKSAKSENIDERLLRSARSRMSTEAGAEIWEDVRKQRKPFKSHGCPMTIKEIDVSL